MNSVQSQMAQMKRELSEDREAADERLIKKMRLNKGLQFKKKSNKKQHQFNETVQDKLESAQKSLNSTPPAIEKAREVLT
jgi:coproporphyrinogen III oxidase-like Fe-S oxidoreductase